MKKIKIITLALAAILFSGIMCFSGCSQKPVIGVLQYGSHASLNNCYTGFLQGLKEGGIDTGKYTVDFQNSNFDSSTSGAQATALVNKGSEMILAIATPSAMAAVSAAKGDIPVVYCAVSDPVGAGFTQGVSNVTGSSDILNFKKQLEMIKAFIPGVQKIGVLYTVTEANSVSQIQALKAEAALQGITIVDKSVNSKEELETVSGALLSEDIDCITNLTDNTVVGYLTNLIAKANENSIPVFGSEIEQVKLGCLASQSIDYVELGRRTGLIAAQILKGEKTADEIEYIKVSDCFPCYNSEVLARFGLTLPEGYKDILDVKE